jgi:hypothetical protein
MLTKEKLLTVSVEDYWRIGYAQYITAARLLLSITMRFSAPAVVQAIRMVSSRICGPQLMSLDGADTRVMTVELPLLEIAALKYRNAVADKLPRWNYITVINMASWDVSVVVMYADGFISFMAGDVYEVDGALCAACTQPLANCQI